MTKSKERREAGEHGSVNDLGDVVEVNISVRSEPERHLIIFFNFVVEEFGECVSKLGC